MSEFVEKHKVKKHEIVGPRAEAWWAWARTRPLLEPTEHDYFVFHAGYDAGSADRDRLAAELERVREEVGRLQKTIAYLYTEPYNFQQLCREEMTKAGIEW